MKNPIYALACFLFLAPCPGLRAAPAPRQMEELNRGVVAVPSADGAIFVSWRLLGTDPENVSFDVYRKTAANPPAKINQTPLSAATHFIDQPPADATDLAYAVSPTSAASTPKPKTFVKPWSRGYLEIPIRPIENYRPGDASVGDLDGDGDYELVLHQWANPKDNSHAGVTGSPILEAYEFDGTFLWRIDLGKNIRDGEHYTQFMVYDLDGDGRAEIACKTADGTKDGTGKMIGDAERDWRIFAPESNKHGRILEGPEFFTIFDGQTGAALTTVDYVPGRDPIDGWGGIGGNGNNDSYGNRCDRFLACVAYLDGERPSVVMCRGVYGRTVMAAWDWREGKLTQRWVFDSGISQPPFRDASKFSGMGGHSLSVADVDADGKDEIVYHSMVVNDDGKGLYSTGLRHGDSMHITDMYPDRPGQEIFTIHENEGRTVRFGTPGAVMRDARTGEILWSHSPGVDVGGGLAADIDPRHRGLEAWGGPGGIRNATGKEISTRKPRTTGFAIWWDGDLLRELLSGRSITKWNWETEREDVIFQADTSRRTRRPTLTGDLIGDWREELIVPAPDGRSLRLYTTTIPTKHRLTTLMHDPQYRLAIAWQNVICKQAAPARPKINVTPTQD